MPSHYSLHRHGPHQRYAEYDAIYERYPELDVVVLPLAPKPVSRDVKLKKSDRSTKQPFSSSPAPKTSDKKGAQVANHLISSNILNYYNVLDSDSDEAANELSHVVSKLESNLVIVNPQQQTVNVQVQVIGCGTPRVSNFDGLCLTTTFDEFSLMLKNKHSLQGDVKLTTYHLTPITQTISQPVGVHRYTHHAITSENFLDVLRAYSITHETLNVFVQSVKPLVIATFSEVSQINKSVNQSIKKRTPSYSAKAVVQDLRTTVRPKSRPLDVSTIPVAERSAHDKASEMQQLTDVISRLAKQVGSLDRIVRTQSRQIAQQHKKFAELVVVLTEMRCAQDDMPSDSSNNQPIDLIDPSQICQTADESSSSLVTNETCDEFKQCGSISSCSLHGVDLSLALSSQDNVYFSVKQSEDEPSNEIDNTAGEFDWGSQAGDCSDSSGWSDVDM